MCVLLSGYLTDCTWFTIFGATGAPWLALALRFLGRLMLLSRPRSLCILCIA